MASSSLVNRNVTVNGGRTSMRLEPEIWDALYEICSRERLGLGELVRRVGLTTNIGGRTSAIRVYAFKYFRAAATEEGHRIAGHGALGGNGR